VSVIGWHLRERVENLPRRGLHSRGINYMDGDRFRFIINRERCCG